MFKGEPVQPIPVKKPVLVLEHVPRKIIQIDGGRLTFSTISRESTTKLFALCDDGTTWSLLDKEWTRLPSIPQDLPNP